MRDNIIDRSRAVTYYQLYVTRNDLKEMKEPLDNQLKEFETVNDLESSSRNDVMLQVKQAYAIVGPDISRIEQGLKYVDLKIATIQTNKTQNKAPAERHTSHLKSLTEQSSQQQTVQTQSIVDHSSSSDTSESESSEDSTIPSSARNLTDDSQREIDESNTLVEMQNLNQTQ